MKNEVRITAEPHQSQLELPIQSAWQLAALNPERLDFS
jgi:hypothetical protein